jgi:hypothetical protein
MKPTAWIDGQSHDVVAVVAARSALRLLPAIELAPDDNRSPRMRRMVVLRTFRAVAVAWAATAYPGDRDALRTPAGVATTDAAPVPYFAVFAAASAAAFAGEMATGLASSSLQSGLAYASQKSSEALALFETAASADCDLLKQGFSPAILAQSPLWSGRVPEWLQENWEHMKGDLLATNEGWDVWTDWYDDRLLGRPGNPTTDVARAGIEVPDEEEDPSPSEVNARIKELIDHREIIDDATAEEQQTSSELPSVDSIPQQVAAASQFVLDAEGRIDLVRDPPLTDGLRREIYQEVRYKALALGALGYNQLAHLSEPLDRFLAVAPERIEDASITLLWSRGNTLRLRLKAHETASVSPEPNDPALLPTLVAEMLRDVVESFNIFVAGDPEGRILDRIRLGPQERHSARAVVHAALPIVNAARARVGLATAAAVEALTEQVEAARNPPIGIDGDQAIELSGRTTGNFVVEILRAAYAPLRKWIAAGNAEASFGWKEIRAGAYRAVGGAGAITGIPAAYIYRQEIIAFIVENAQALKVFVEQAFHNPTLVRIIELISQSVAGP